MAGKSPELNSSVSLPQLERCIAGTRYDIGAVRAPTARVYRSFMSSQCSEENAILGSADIHQRPQVRAFDPRDVPISQVRVYNSFEERYPSFDGKELCSLGFAVGVALGEGFADERDGLAALGGEFCEREVVAFEEPVGESLVGPIF